MQTDTSGGNKRSVKLRVMVPPAGSRRLELATLPTCRHRGPETFYFCFPCSSGYRHEPVVTRRMCQDCQHADRGGPVLKNTPASARVRFRPRPTPAPADGPGTELEVLIKRLGLTREGCGGCQGLKKQMNRWGLSGCRDRRESILAKLRTAYKELTPAEAAAAAWHALWSGVAFKVNPLDPAPGLLDEALRRWAARAPAADPGAVNSKPGTPARE